MCHEKLKRDKEGSEEQFDMVLRFMTGDVIQTGSRWLIYVQVRQMKYLGALVERKIMEYRDV